MSKVMQERVQEQAIGAALQIAQRQVDEEHIAKLVLSVPGDQAVFGFKQYRAVVGAGGAKCRIAKIVVQVTRKGELAFAAGGGSGVPGHLLQPSRRFTLAGQRNIFTRRNSQCLHSLLRAPDLIERHGAFLVFVIERVTHAHQVREPGFVFAEEPIQVESAGVIDQHELAATMHVIMQSADQRLIGIAVNLIRNDQSGGMKLDHGIQQGGIANGLQMQPFFFGGIQPLLDQRVILISGIWHQQKQGVNAVAVAHSATMKIGSRAQQHYQHRAQNSSVFGQFFHGCPMT